MERPKLVAVITGVISILLAIAYLVVVQLLDFRGEMQPAPITLRLALPGDVQVAGVSSGCPLLGSEAPTLPPVG